jgi:hypothetical protein
MSGDARDFNNIETRAVIKFFFLLGKAPKEIHAIIIEILGEHAPSYATVKNWVAQFKRDDFSTCDAPRIDCLHMQNVEDLGFKLRKPSFKYRPEKQLSSFRFFAVSISSSKFLGIPPNARAASFHILFYSSYHKTVQARVWFNNSIVKKATTTIEKE